MHIYIYARLSVQDKSESIQNQLDMGRRYVDTKYAHDKDIVVEEVFDEGYSGSNMDRPGIKHILNGIGYVDNNDTDLYGDYIYNDSVNTNNSINNYVNRNYNSKNIYTKNECIYNNVIIVKDISRIGRNYIEVGKFLRELAILNTHLVVLSNSMSINNEYDIESIMADMYSKDISIKTKSVLDMNKSKGIYSIGKVPYGYRKSYKDKHKIIVYEKEAKNVRKIYELYEQGKTIKQIVEYMNEVTHKSDSRSNISEKKINWSYQKIYGILHNEFYKGYMVYGKSIGHIWEGKRREYISRKQWKKIPNHHEPIVYDKII